MPMTRPDPAITAPQSISRFLRTPLVPLAIYPLQYTLE
jgi:hypothetical protein